MNCLILAQKSCFIILKSQWHGGLDLLSFLDRKMLSFVPENISNCTKMQLKMDQPKLPKDTLLLTVQLHFGC